MAILSHYARVKDGSQHWQILWLLRDGRRHANSEIGRLEPRVLQYPRVISDLRLRGYRIEAEMDSTEPSRWWYQWVRADAQAATVTPQLPQASRTRRRPRPGASHNVAALRAPSGEGLFKEARP